jgi:hypothetical protein
LFLLLLLLLLLVMDDVRRKPLLHAGHCCLPALQMQEFELVVVVVWC